MTAGAAGSFPDEERRERQGPGRLDREVQPKPCHADRLGDLVLGHGDDFVNQASGDDDLESLVQHRQRAHAIRQGDRRIIEVDPVGQSVNERAASSAAAGSTPITLIAGLTCLAQSASR